MSILLVNFLVSLVVVVFAQSDKKASRYAALFMFACVFILHAFADISSLEDLTAYSLGFEEIKKMSVWQCITTNVVICKMERGFALILKLFSLLGLNFRAFLIANSLFVSLLFYKGIVKYSPSILTSCLLFLLVINSQSIYVLRQYLVMSIFFYSIRWVIERNVYKYLTVCFVCFFIHQSSLILIPLYFLYNIGLKKLLAILLLSTFILNKFIEVVLNYFLSNLAGYGSYASFEKLEGQNSTGFIISIVYLLLYVWYLKRDIWTEGIKRLLFVCALLNILLLYFGIGLDFSARLSIYFGSLNILLVPIMLNYVKAPLVRYTILVGCLILNSIITFYGSLSMESSNYRLASFLS